MSVKTTADYEVIASDTLKGLEDISRISFTTGQIYGSHREDTFSRTLFRTVTHSYSP